MRTRMLWIVLGITPWAVSAQPPLRPPGGPAIPTPGGLIPGNNWQPPLQSQVSVLAAQLQLEVQQTRVILQRLPLNAGQRMTVLLAADRALAAVQQFQRVAQSTTDRNQLLRAHAQMDPPLEAMERVAQQFAPGHPALASALARVQFADERIHAALQIGGPNTGDQQRQATARLARAIDDQTMELRSLLMDLNGPGFNVSLRNFAFRAAQIHRSIDAGQPISVPQEQWNQLVGAWNQLTPSLSLIVPKNPPVRGQVARIDRLIHDLGAVLRGESLGPGPGISPVVPPGPPIGPNPWPDHGFLPRSDRLFVLGAGEGGGPHVKVVHDLTGSQSTDFFAYNPSYRGGVRVAVADVNGDGVPDIVTAPGKMHPPLIRVFNGRDLSLMQEFIAYDAPFDLGVFVAAADFNNGRALVAVGPGLGGPPHVKVFDLIAGQVIDEFFPFPQEWRCGARPALGDVNGDLVPDLIVSAGAGVLPQVNIYDGRNRQLLRSIQAQDRSWQGGLFVAAGDVTRNGRDDVMIGSDVGGPSFVRSFDARNGRMIGEFRPYPVSFHAGARVTVFDANSDGIPDVVVAPGPATVAMPVQVYDGRTQRLVSQFYPYGADFKGGAWVASR